MAGHLHPLFLTFFSLSLSTLTLSSPLQQIPLTPSSTSLQFNPLHHLSAISPYFIPHPNSNSPPEGCVISRATILVRHGSITANDDEFEETMEPFIDKLESLSFAERKKIFSRSAELAFLETWKTPVNSSTLELPTLPGRKDAKSLGHRFSKQYRQLMPTKKDNFSVFTASSERDVETAKAWILGAMPGHAGEGTGDGHVRMIPLERAKKNGETSRSLIGRFRCRSD